MSDEDNQVAGDAIELTNSSDENQNVGGENNTPGEGHKNQSNFKKLARKVKERDKEIERLRAKLLAKAGMDEDEDEDDFDLEDDDSSETFSDVKSELFFLKNKDAELYREEMQELLEDNPSRKALQLSDLLDLAKAKFPKSTVKKTFSIPVAGNLSQESLSKIDTSKMSAEEIDALPLDMYKKLFPRK